MKTLYFSFLLLFLAGFNFAQNVPSYVPTNGLVGWWPFSGNAIDSSGNGNNGTVNSATLTTDRNGVANRAYSFDGVDDYINITNNVLPTTSTSNSVSLWFKTVDNDAHLLLDRSTLSNVYRTRISISNANVAAGGENGNCSGSCTCYSSNTAFSRCDWNHVVLVNNLSANTSKLYLNGVIVGTRNSFCYTNFSSPTSIGRGNSAYAPFGDAYLMGRIDDVAIWTRALSEQEILNLFQNYQPQPINTNLSQTTCGSFTINGQTYSQTGTYVQNFTNTSGCDSTLTLNLIINQPTTNTINQSACTSYILNGQTYTQSGTYTQVRTNAAGCDSTITLNLTINQPTTNTITQSACSSFSLNGQTYTQSGTYTQVRTNAAGCDSTITLNLTINQPTTSTITQSACSSYSLNGQTYTQSGTYTQVRTNVAGCDSTITLNLTINQPPTASSNVSNTTFHGASDGAADLTVSGSSPFSFVWSNGTTTEDLNNVASGTYSVTISDANGCTNTTSVTVNQPPLSVVQNSLKTELKVYPNPADKILNVELSNFNQMMGYKLSINNSLGQTVYSQELSLAQFSIDLNSWKVAGTYFVELIDQNGNKVESKIIMVK
jgi:hypothetical protein